MMIAAGCIAPHYTSGHLKCATSGRACPDNFYCGADDRCWANGDHPDLAGIVFDFAEASPVDLAGVDIAGRDLAVSSVDMAHRDMAMTLSTDMATSQSLCSGLTVKLCDGFEGAALNARWTSGITNGTIAIDTARAYRGASSVHLHTSPEPTATADPEANLLTYQSLPIATTIYIRAWAYYPSTNPPAFNQLLNFSNAGQSGVSYCIDSDRPVINDYTTGGPFNESSAFSIPTDQWTCLQMEIPQPANMMGTIRVFIDGAEVTDVTTTNTAPTPSFDHVYVGLDFVGNPANLPAADLWIDELIIDDKPTTCAE